MKQAACFLFMLVSFGTHAQQRTYNKALASALDSIYYADQNGRMKIDSIEKQYGPRSAEMMALWEDIQYHDSINVIRVTALLDTYGWPGKDEVGETAASAVFLVIQHADLKVQEKYLPLMREAVKQKKQIYGSQLSGDGSGTYQIDPLEDPRNVDKRRAAVGLGPLADYLKRWNIVWDAEEYIKNAPITEKAYYEKYGGRR
jgi:hypothetical protein